MVTDWDIIGRMHPWSTHLRHHTERKVARHALHAGNDMISDHAELYQDTRDALARGEADMADVDAAVRNVLRLKFRLGLFENPRLPDIPKAVATAAGAGPAHAGAGNRPASRLCCSRTGASCRWTDRVKKLAVIGPNADDWVHTHRRLAARLRAASQYPRHVCAPRIHRHGAARFAEPAQKPSRLATARAAACPHQSRAALTRYRLCPRHPALWRRRTNRRPKNPARGALPGR
ncbi:MAG: hypothetical protein IPO35_17250 [Uliginosibacterium sp.]|nr:hypothetical protein [Uliginosibacterium sp.]